MIKIIGGLKNEKQKSRNDSGSSELYTRYMGMECRIPRPKTRKRISFAVRRASLSASQSVRDMHNMNKGDIYDVEYSGSTSFLSQMFSSPDIHNLTKLRCSILERLSQASR